MYQVLEDIYDEWQDIFNFDSFHMGGDEVNNNTNISNNNNDNYRNNNNTD